MTSEQLEATRKCSRSHSGPRDLYAHSSAGKHFECAGCMAIYSRREVEEARSEFPTCSMGVELVAS